MFLSLEKRCKNKFPNSVNNPKISSFVKKVRGERENGKGKLTLESIFQLALPS